MCWLQHFLQVCWVILHMSHTFANPNKQIAATMSWHFHSIEYLPCFLLVHNCPCSLFSFSTTVILFSILGSSLYVVLATILIVLLLDNICKGVPKSQTKNALLHSNYEFTHLSHNVCRLNRCRAEAMNGGLWFIVHIMISKQTDRHWSKHIHCSQSCYVHIRRSILYY